MNLYMDFIPGMVAADGVIRGPAGDGRVSAILRDDVAAAAAAVLTSDGHDGTTYDLTGPSSFSLAEAAELLGARFEDETDEQAYASRASYGAPDWEVRGWVTSYQAIRDGSLDVVSPAMRELTGRDAVVAGRVPEGLSSGRVALCRAGLGLRGLFLAVLRRRVGRQVRRAARPSPRRPPRPPGQRPPDSPATAWSSH